VDQWWEWTSLCIDPEQEMLGKEYLGWMRLPALSTDQIQAEEWIEFGVDQNYSHGSFPTDWL
jgi:hypothetical protein